MNEMFISKHPLSLKYELREEKVQQIVNNHLTQ